MMIEASPKVGVAVGVMTGVSPAVLTLVVSLPERASHCCNTFLYELAKKEIV